MAIDQSNRFECPDCGIDMLATFVSYDALGYAVCPFCDRESSQTEAEPQSEGANAEVTDHVPPSDWQWGVGQSAN